jgi:hypothetical protein
MLPGTYSNNITVTSKTFNLIGPTTTLNGTFMVSSGANVSVRSVDFESGVQCGASSGPDATLSLKALRLNAASSFFGCTLTASEVDFSSINAPDFGGGVSGNQGITATIDRSHINGTNGSVSISGPPQLVSFHMTNSIIETMPSFTLSATMATNVVFSFNTFFTNIGEFIGCSSPFPAGVSFDDNIIFGPNVGTGNIVQVPSQCVFDTNIIFPQSSSVGINTITLNPSLVDPVNGNFHLKAGSPAIGHAKPNATDTIDYDGVTRPSGGADIGALQFKP